MSIIMSGPCLCGDPACHACFPGNNAQQFEELCDQLSEYDNLTLRTISLCAPLIDRAVQERHSTLLLTFEHNEGPEEKAEVLFEQEW